MGLIKRIVENVKGEQAYDLTFVPSIPAPDLKKEGIGEPIKADSCYIQLYLESLRLEKARRFATSFHAVVYSYLSLSREGEERAQLAAVSKPEKLAQLDENSLDHVITVTKEMVGATPFRGGTVSIELGLFSVKSGNVLSPVLDYVTRVSSTAGIGFVGAIKPFLPLITEGMDLIAGQKQDTALEVGVEMDLTLDSGCVMAIIDQPKETIDVEKLTLDKDRRLLLDGKVLDCGYAVFSVRPTTQKSDFGEIPELKERYSELMTAISKGKMKDAQDALTAFRLATVASPDLIESDADALVQKANQKFNRAFTTGGGVPFAPKAVKIERLSDIGLYK
jgi:hypothetical protein